MTSKKMGLVAIVAAAALSLTGCFKEIANYTLHADNTVSGNVIVAIDKDYANGMTGNDAITQLGADNPVANVAGVTQANYDDGKYVGVKYTFTNVPLDTMASDMSGTVTRVGDTFVFEGTAIDQSQFQGMEQYMSTAVATLSMTFPGEVTDTNGTVKGTTVTWDMLKQTEAPKATGSAIGNGSAGGGVPAWLGLLLGGLALLVVAGVVVLLVTRNKGKEKAEASAAEMAPAAKSDKKSDDKKSDKKSDDKKSDKKSDDKKSDKKPADKKPAAKADAKKPAAKKPAPKK